MRPEALPEIALAVASERTREAVLDRIVRGLAADPSVALVRIWLLAAGDQCQGCRMAPDCTDRSTCLHLVASAGNPRAADEDWSRLTGDYRRIPLNVASKISRVGARGEPILLDDFRAALAESPLMRPEWAEAEGITSFAGQPLLFRGELLGMLGVFLRAPLGEERFRALRSFADQAAVAIANARAFDEVAALQTQLAAERDRLRVLLEIGRAVSGDLTLNGLFEATGTALRWVLPHEWSNLAVRRPGERTLRLCTLTAPVERAELREGLEIPLQGTPAGWVAEHGRSFLAATQAELLERIEFERLRALVQVDGMRSGCVVPLFSRGRVVGTLGFGSRREGCFGPAELELIEQIAAQIAPAVDNALAYERLDALKAQLEREKVYLEDELQQERSLGELVGQSAALRALQQGIETVAATSSTVLIQGETGTGKELVARAIHRLSGRNERTFVKLNCAAIPTGLLESELFGHEKGAFTGAVAAKAGRFELADGGTLFLDEIGEIAPELQPKLLRVLQDQEFERLGGTKTLRTDVRVVAATNRDLAQMVAARQFRSDLFYRLNVFPLAVPPLRERVGDVPLLVRHFVERFARSMGKTIDTIPVEALEALQRYPWPGNVRELSNLIERSVILSRGSVLAVPLSELAITAMPAPATVTPVTVTPVTVTPVTVTPVTAMTPPAPAAAPLAAGEAQERETILAALEACGWRVGGERGAAARLGLSRTTLQSRMLRLGIVRPGS